MADKIVRVQDGFVFRNGGKSDDNLTPRPEDDVSTDLREAGVSTWRKLESAIAPGRKGIKIDVAKIDPAALGCFEDEEGHVSIVPVDPAGQLDRMKLAEWAATRGSGSIHPLTQMLLGAVDNHKVRRPK